MADELTALRDACFDRAKSGRGQTFARDRGGWSPAEQEALIQLQADAAGARER